MTENQTGQNNPNWKGGPVHAFGDNWLTARRRTLDRDRVCQACGEDGSERFLDVHHIVPRSAFEEVEQSNTPLNLVVLCRRCHKLAEHGSIPCPHPEIRDASPADEIRRYLDDIHLTGRI